MKIPTKTKPTARFQPGHSGNPKGRPKGVPDRRSAWREALADHLPELLDHLVARAKAGDEFAIKAILERVAPPLRAHGPSVDVPGMSSAVGLAAKAEVVLMALGDGQISVDSGRALLEAIGALAKITEVDELLKRVEELERKKESKP